jgi:hypothetical protein
MSNDFPSGNWEPAGLRRGLFQSSFLGHHKPVPVKARNNRDCRRGFLLLALMLLLAGCSASKPSSAGPVALKAHGTDAGPAHDLPPEPPAIVLPAPSSKAKAKSKSVTAIVPPPPSRQLGLVPFTFPTTINPSNYWWNLESSTNPASPTWQVAQSNVSLTVTVTNSLSAQFFRLSGRLSP